MRKLLYRNFRLVHRLSERLRRRLTPGGSLVFGGIIASGIFGIDTQQTLAFQIFTITASLMLVAVLCTATFRCRLRLQRLLPDYATAGQPLKYRIRVENRSPVLQQDLLLMDELETRFPEYAEFATARDPHDEKRNWFDRMVGYPRLVSQLRHRRGGSIPARPIPPVPAFDRSDLEIEFTPFRRGYLRFSGASIARPDPLGLFRALRRFQADASLLILPHTYRVPRLQLPGSRKYQEGGMTLVSSVGDSQEFMSLRDYQPGDPMRAIHWPSYAKRGKPVVKEFQDEFFVRQGLVLDTFVENASLAQFEEAVSVAASFQLAVQQQDALLDLMFVEDRSYRYTSGRGLGSTANMLEVLACVQPCRDQPFSCLEDLLMGHAGEISGLILILLDWDEKRRDLVRRLRAVGTPVVTFRISAGEDAPAPSTVDREPLITLPAGRVQEYLDAVDWDNLQL
ncbi:MAG: DUF58 domain-containing protein [Gammaproteobacteria bacterium]|jgi:uncharacterized protein (DUF58 family)